MNSRHDFDFPILADRVEAILGPRGYLYKPEDLSNYEYDGSIDKAKPDLVAFPQSTAEVVALVKLAHEHGIPVTGRGAGTGLSGGAIARDGRHDDLLRAHEPDSRNRPGQ